MYVCILVSLTIDSSAYIAKSVYRARKYSITFDVRRIKRVKNKRVYRPGKCWSGLKKKNKLLKHTKR